MAVQITSVAKKGQPWSEAAAAIHLITRDDIRRSGATSVPELLRQAPGVHVARIDGSRYSISIRGFSGRFSANLLVLIDGRSIYTPLFSGVYWEGETQGVVLEDIERIEVIRGPGGSLWGANAVSGVINIITRSAHDTRGGLLKARAGDLEHSLVVRHGGKLGEDGSFRIYAKGDGRGALDTPAGGTAHDGSRSLRAGFRADLPRAGSDSVTVQGDVHQVRADQTLGISRLVPVPGTVYGPDTADFGGGNLLLRWRRELSSDADWQFQAYVDRADLRDAALHSRITTVDLELQHRSALSPNQELTWGLGYRHIGDELDGTFTISFTPPRQSTRLLSGFAQDAISIDDALRLTLGAKLEHNGYTGLEFQPSARLAWRVATDHLVWGALSRAVRTPSRANRDGQLNYLVIPGVPSPRVLSEVGSSRFQSEKLVATEIGYRGQVTKVLTVDAALFYNDHQRLRSTQMPVVTSLPPYLGISSAAANQGFGKASGAELSLLWQATPAWRLRATYSRLRLDIGIESGSTDTTLPARIAGRSPQSQFQLHSMHNLSDQFDLDWFFYRVDKLAGVSGSAGAPVPIPAVDRLDLRLGWRPSPGYEVSVAAQNVLDARHVEFSGLDTVASAVPRSIYVQLRRQF